MPHALPLPTLDHVVVNARDRLDEAAELYARLGFTLTPRGYHTLGSMNHLAMFGTDYLELIAVPPGSAGRPEILASPVGLDGLVFRTEDAAITYAALREAGLPIEPPQQFSRPVTLSEASTGDHSADAVFRTTRLQREAVPAGRLYFCQHLTRNLVWRDEWQHHRNGAVGIARAVIAAQEPEVLGGLFRRMFGPLAVRTIDEGCALTVGLARFDIVTPAALWEMFGEAAAESRGRRDYMAALSLRTVSLDAAERALEDGGIRGIDRVGASVLVPASEAFGVTLEFSV